VDRIFTITEGKGITGVLCAIQPCLQKPVPKAHPTVGSTTPASTSHRPGGSR